MESLHVSLACFVNIAKIAAVELYYSLVQADKHREFIIC